MYSPARDKLERLLLDPSPAAPLHRFRVAFATIWIARDVLDIIFDGTAGASHWLRAITGPPPLLLALQVGIIACTAAALSPAYASAGFLGAAALRAAQAIAFVRLNDLYFAAVVCVLLAAVPWRDDRGDRGDRGDDVRPSAAVPRWMSGALIAQMAVLYLATGLLKLSPAWLSGGHLFVRFAHLDSVSGWPYPDVVRPCLASLSCDAALAWAGVLAELALGALLVARRGRLVAVALAVSIHGFAALMTNVWFFGASMVAAVLILFPKRAPPPSPPCAPPCAPRAPVSS
jgi:hypothetical protein